jgi:hypothetical protein
MSASIETGYKTVYWRQEFPPLTADVFGADTIEATSGRVQGGLSHRDDAWVRCYQDLIERLRVRLEQEVMRRSGHYAHVRDEHIEARHDEANGEAWLYGRFQYVLYREPDRVCASV